MMGLRPTQGYLMQVSEISEFRQCYAEYKTNNLKTNLIVLAEASTTPFYHGNISLQN